MQIGKKRIKNPSWISAPDKFALGPWDEGPNGREDGLFRLRKEKLSRKGPEIAD